MNIQKDEKGKLLLTLIKGQQQISSTVQRINCIVIIQLIKNIWYLMQLLDYPKKMSIAVSFFFFQKKKLSIAIASSLYHSLRMTRKTQ